MNGYRMISRYVFLGSVVVFLLAGVGWADELPGDAEVGGGFQRFFYAGGWLVWIVLLPLSLFTVKLIVQHLILVRRSRLLPTAVVSQCRELLAESQVKKTIDYVKQEGSFLARVVHVGLTELKNGRATMENAMAELLEQDTTELLRKIEWLNIIGNVAPMVGLFGTVWGMIDAFNGIILAGGQPAPADLAGGISTALVTTWWGMVVAIPALATYGFLRNRIDLLSAHVAVAAEELLRDIQTP